jgi:hypothetical protein
MLLLRAGFAAREGEGEREGEASEAEPEVGLVSWEGPATEWLEGPGSPELELFANERREERDERRR